jgi:multidrug transporter EmrE-like cation transporter
MSTELVDFLYNATGITGIALIIIAYFLLQVGKISSTSLSYPLLNLIGAVLHLISLYRFYNLPSVIIEIFWIAISVYGIIKIKNLKSN